MVRTAIQGCLVAFVAFLVTRGWRRLRAESRAWIWWLVLAQFAFAPFWFAPLRLGTSERFAEHPVAQTVARWTSLEPTGGAVLGRASTGLPTGWLAALWGVGALVVLSGSVRGTLALIRLRRSAEPASEPVQAMARRLAAEAGLPTPPPVLVTDAIGSPAAFGLLRPCILLPHHHEDLSGEELEMILTHEIAHLLRRDAWLALVPEIATILFWWFPPVWLVRREWTVQRELACDGIVYERIACPAKDYRRLLIRMVEGDRNRVPKGALGATADFRCLKRRLAADRPASRNRLAGALAVGLLLVLSLPVSFASPPRESGLLANAGFERGESDPAGWQIGQRIDKVRYAWADDAAHTGKRSLTIRKRLDRYFPIAEWIQTVPYDGRSAAVEFSGWVKTENAYKAVLDVQFNTDEGFSTHGWVAYIGVKKDGDPPANHDWKLLGGSVKVPKGTKSISLALQMYGPGQIWLDDVSARYVSRATVSQDDPK